MSKPAAKLERNQQRLAAMLVWGAATALIVLLVVFPLFQTVWTTGMPREKTMLLTAGVGVAGTFFSAIVGVLLFNRQQRLRELEREAQEQREKDTAAGAERQYQKSMAAALRAEIRESLDRLAEQFTEASILETMESAGQNIDKTPASGMPVGVAMEENIIFDTHREKLFEMPEELVRALVRYYQNDRYLNRYLDRMSNGAFSELEPDRQKRMVAIYLDVGRTTFLAAMRARTMLDAYLVHIHADNKDVAATVTAQRAADSFDGFPADTEIADMLDHADRTNFEDELLKEADDPDTGLDRFERYLSAGGITP